MNMPIDDFIDNLRDFLIQRDCDGPEHAGLYFRDWTDSQKREFLSTCLDCVSAHFVDSLEEPKESN